MDEKQKAIEQYYERESEIAKEAFQKDVNDLLAHITKLTNQLMEAKRRFAELKYIEPKKVDLGL